MSPRPPIRVATLLAILALSLAALGCQIDKLFFAVNPDEGKITIAGESAGTDSTASDSTVARP